MSVNTFIHKLRRRLTRLRLQPIRVFCFHHVSDEYNPLLAWECDWTSTQQFKKNIQALKQQYTFISLPQAQSHLQHDFFRFRKYAVLTADDGYKSLYDNVLRGCRLTVPITLFVNAHYLDGESWSAHQEEQSRRANPQVDMKQIAERIYMTREELFSLQSPLITIGSHGWEHIDSTTQTLDDFECNVDRCMDVLSHHPHFIPFHAFPWGRASQQQIALLQKKGIVSVLCNGRLNYNDSLVIERIPIDGQ